MGLLDNFFGNGFEDPRTAAVLQLAAGLQSGRTLGQGLTQGAIGYNSTLANARAQAQAQQALKTQQALQQQLIQAQIGETNAQTQQRQAQAAEAERRAAEQQRQMQLLQRAFSPVTPIQANQASGVTGPRPEALASVGQQAPVNYQQLIAQGLPPELVKSLADAANFGRSKVARTIKGMGPDGREFEYQVDEFGNRIGEGLAQYRAPITVNQGNRTTFADPYNLKPMGAFQTFQSPDSAASVGATLRGQNMADARARESNAVQSMNGRIPTGYRLKPDGNLEAIPGGPADIKAGELGAKTEAKRQAQLASSESVRATVKEAADMVGVTTTGIGSWAKVLPATEARNLSAKLETIKANLGFDRLQEMRDQSPTGGALGAVAVQELTALQSTVSSLDQAQSPSQLRSSLAKIDRHYSRWQKVMQGQNPNQAGGATGSWDAGNSPAPTAGQPSIDDLLKKYGGK